MELYIKQCDLQKALITYTKSKENKDQVKEQLNDLIQMYRNTNKPDYVQVIFNALKQIRSNYTYHQFNDLTNDLNKMISDNKVIIDIKEEASNFIWDNPFCVKYNIEIMVFK